MMVEDKIRQQRLNRAARITAALISRGTSLTNGEAVQWGVRVSLEIEKELDRKTGN